MNSREAIGPEKLLELKSEYLIPCVYHFYKSPPQIVAGEDCTLIDHLGRRYLDCYSGVTVMNAGHCNPEINAAVIRQIQTLQHTTTIYLTEPLLRLAEKLAEITPGELKRSFFCNSGSEANEGAMLLACLHTNRSEIIAINNSLHGRTKWAMSATGLAMWRTDPDPIRNVHLINSDSEPESIEHRIQEIGPDRVAALIAEPIQGNGGIVIPPDEYWPQVREICHRHGVLLIFDEVQTGINRTGRWYACEHWNVVPDILTTAKALGNGFPISAFVTTDPIAGSYTRPGASTFGGNPVSATAALATINYHQRYHLGERSEEMGNRLLAGLHRLVNKFSSLLNARGRGLMTAVDVTNDRGEPNPEKMDILLEALKDRGILCGKTGPGRNVLTLMPPLTIQAEQIDLVLNTLSEVLTELPK